MIIDVFNTVNTVSRCRQLSCETVLFFHHTIFRAAILILTNTYRVIEWKGALASNWQLFQSLFLFLIGNLKKYVIIIYLNDLITWMSIHNIFCFCVLIVIRCVNQAKYVILAVFTAFDVALNWFNIHKIIV